MELKEGSVDWFLKNLWIGEIGLVAFVWFLVHLAVKKFLLRSKLEILGKIFTIAVSFVSLLLILQILGLDIVPLVTFGGIGAAALGIASKDVVSNFFGALMIYATRPFKVGDQIELPDKGIQGTVEMIGWYHTEMRDAQKNPIYVPNSVFPLSFIRVLRGRGTLSSLKKLDEGEPAHHDKGGVHNP